MKGKRVDLVGQKFGLWTVVRRAGSKIRPNGLRSDALWLCRCDCGTERTIPSGNLTGGRSRRCNRYCRIIKPNVDAGFNALFKRYQKSAEQRGLEFLLTAEEFKVLTSSNCFYCGALPVQNLRMSKIPYLYNGIDRLANSQGYTRSNSVTCCGECNDMKGTLDVGEFLERVNRIHVRLLEESVHAL